MKIGFQGIEGYVYGALQPSAVLTFDAQQPPNSRLDKALSELSDHLSADRTDALDAETGPTAGPPAVTTQITCLLDRLNARCGDQRFTRIHLMHEGERISYAIPTLSSTLVLKNLEAVFQFINSSHGSLNPSWIEKFCEERKNACRRYLPSGTNSGNFIAAAVKRRIPFKIFSTNHLIFGYGSGSWIFNSTISEQESAIGVPLAKSKVLTNKLLGMSGFPVPDQARVQTVDEAVRHASGFGYPVVLKPDGEAQGRGIRADIRDEEELRHCFEEVSKDHDDLILEKHVPGDHYRVDFMGDELIKAVRRRPASVIGDGKTTIRKLVEKLNSDPARSDIYSSLKPVVFDTDLEVTLAKQSLSLEAVPPGGQRVVLRSISNLSRGGEQQDFRDCLHIDNLNLCLSVARTLRLDVAGVDLISKDASKPWHKNNAAICEVNAQPQLGASRTEVYWHFLSRYPLSYPPVRIIIGRTIGRKHVPLFDKTLDEIDIRLTPEDVFDSGCPTQYFTSLEITDDVPEEDRRKLAGMLVSIEPEIESGAPVS